MDNKLINLIRQNPNIEFGNKDNGANNQEILYVQKTLGFILPDEYIYWLKNYGGGKINGEEIFSIYKGALNNTTGGDLVYIDNLLRRDNFISNDELAIQMNDQAEIYFFLKNNEQVFVKFGNLEEVHAKSFFEFLEKKINTM